MKTDLAAAGGGFVIGFCAVFFDIHFSWAILAGFTWGFWLAYQEYKDRYP